MVSIDGRWGCGRAPGALPSGGRADSRKRTPASGRATRAARRKPPSSAPAGPGTARRSTRCSRCTSAPSSLSATASWVTAEDAEDAAQETFLRALRALPGFRGEAAFRTWLFRIALNVCLGRKSSQRSIVSWDEERSSPTPAAASPEAIALRQMRIQEALAGLLPRQRALLLLKEREGWSVTEIAVALRWSERQVRYELSKTRLALAEWRRDEGEGDER